MRLIDADALIEAMEERKKIWLSETEYNDAIRKVKEAPTIERQHGEWIDKGEYAECSLCGSCSGTQFDGVEPIPLKTNFCPNCGADMREEGDEK